MYHHQYSLALTYRCILHLLRVYVYVRNHVDITSKDIVTWVITTYLDNGDTSGTTSNITIGGEGLTSLSKEIGTRNRRKILDQTRQWTNILPPTPYVAITSCDEHED